MLASRVMVLPSFAEGLPVVIMEALALGRPVVTTYIAGIPELVEPGVDGVGGLADVERSGHDLLARLGGTRYRGVEGCAGSVIWKLRSWT